MDDNIEIRPFDPGDEGQYLDLYNFVHPVSMSAEYWQWLNVLNPEGRSLIETAWDGKRLVGMYGLVPVRFSAGGKEVSGALSDVAVTHPDYRYRGVFSALGKSLYRRAGEAGIKLIYGFPTEHSRHGFQKALGWEYVKESRELACWGCSASFRDAGSVEVSLVDSVGEDFDLLWGRVAGAQHRNEILAERGSNRLNWRFTRHPENSYTIFLARDGSGPAGYMAVRQVVESGEAYADIVDIVAVDVRCFRDLAAFAPGYFREAGCIRIRLPAGCMFHHIAAGLGYKNGGGRFYFGCKDLENGQAGGLEWYYTMSDAGEV